MGTHYARLQARIVLWIAFVHVLHLLLELGPTFRLTHRARRDANMISVDTISLQILPQARDEEHNEYDEDSELEKIGIQFEKGLQSLASRMDDSSYGGPRLKLRYGDKVCEVVVGKENLS